MENTRNCIRCNKSLQKSDGNAYYSYMCDTCTNRGGKLSRFEKANLAYEMVKNKSFEELYNFYILTSYNDPNFLGYERALERCVLEEFNTMKEFEEYVKEETGMTLAKNKEKIMKQKGLPLY